MTLRVSTRAAGTDTSEQDALELLAAQAARGASTASAPDQPSDETGPSRTLVLSGSRSIMVSENRHVQVY